MTARERRVVQASGVLVTGILLLRIVGPALGQLTSVVDRARTSATLAAQARVLVAHGPARQALLRRRADQIVGLAPVLVGGHSAAEAAATLAGEVNVVAARHRVAIIRLDPLPDSAAGSLAPVHVRVHAESDLVGLYGFIHDIESGALLLSFAEIAIYGQDPVAAMERLRLEGTVQGWMVARVGGGDASSTGRSSQ